MNQIYPRRVHLGFSPYDLQIPFGAKTPIVRRKLTIVKLLGLCLALLSPLLARAADRVLINEIMYEPATLSTSEEWIELYNPGTNAIDLSGWRFTKGIDFTFPFAVIAPNNYFIIAANPDLFLTLH